MPRIAILDLSFHWPPTGGSWVDIASVARELGRAGAEVRLFVPRLDTGGLRRGFLAHEPPVAVETVRLSLRDFTLLALPKRLARVVEGWEPDYVVVSNTFAMAPWLIHALGETRLVLRIYGYEMLCPYYMSLWPRGRISQWATVNPRAEVCEKNFLSSPLWCSLCAIRGMGRELLPRWMNPFSHEYVASAGFLPFYHRAVRRALDRAYAILVSNEFTAGLLKPWSTKVRVVPGGVDTHRFRPDDHRRGIPVVLMAGRVDDPRKGYAVFREMVHRLVERGVRFHARVTDPRYDGNSPHIESLGWVSYDRMPQVLAGASVVVVPTMWPEPFGLVTLEAMACGVPVVAHRIGGLSHLVKDGETGFLVDPGDVATLADRVGRLLTDQALWERCADASRRGAEAFSWERIVQGHYRGLFGLETRGSS